MGVRLLLYTHPSCWEHDTGGWHPERAARLDAAIEGARRSSLEVAEREAPEVPMEALCLVHRPGYVAHIRDFIQAGGGSLDPDTVASPGSWAAALHSAGAGLAAVEALENGEGDVAFLAVRPPGHHATRDRAMGFCLFNNIGVTAATIAERGQRVAIVDWDVHHGNASQDMFYARRDILYISTHEFPFYPGSGWIDESGKDEGEGFNINIPLPAGTAGDAYEEAWTRLVVPVLEEMKPDWILVSAGFDGHADDPLANVCLREPDYGRMAWRLARLAPSRLVFFLEGGYELDAISSSVMVSLNGVAGEFPELTGDESPPRARHMVQVSLAQAGKYWDVG
ncbi:MAG: putative deacetylase [Acidobacteria bacterium]|nr:putative deacetylase [Acidobacteriota bacterium]